MKLMKVFFCCLALLASFSFFERSWKVSAKTDEYVMFDQYSKLTSREEKARLDNLAYFLLQDEPTFIAYIIAYDGKTSCKGEAQIRARRAKNYLLSKHKISSERIVIVDGHYQEKLSFEFYTFPKEATSPVASPTLEENEVKSAGNCKVKENL